MLGKDFVTFKLMWNVKQTNDAAKKADIRQNYLNYGAVTAYGEMLQSLGAKTYIPVYRDNNDCIQIPYIEVDGQRHLEAVKEAAS